MRKNNSDALNDNAIVQKGMSKGWQRFFMFTMFVPLLTITIELDNDIWFLLNGGRYVLANGIPVIEPFSIHEGFGFVMQQWLSSVIFFLCDSTLGHASLFLIVAILLAVTIVALYRLCMLVSDGNFLVSFGVTAITGELLSMFFRTRPQIFTIAILACALLALEKYALTQRMRHLAFLPLLSALLINVHASMWLMMFVMMLPYIVDSFAFKISIVKGAGYRKLPLLAAVAVSFVAGFLNPYGLDAMTYVFRSYGHDEISSIIGEMLPPYISSSVGMVIYASFLAVVLIYCLHRSGTTRLRYVLLTLGTAFLALSNARSYMLFLLAASFPIAAYLKDFCGKSSANSSVDGDPAEVGKIKRDPHEGRQKVIAAIMVVLIACLFPLKFFSQKTARFSAPSADAVSFLIENSSVDKVRLYTGYDDGDYAQYIGIKTYIDARAEVYCVENNGKADIMQEYYDLQLGLINYRDVLEKYKFTHLLVGSGDILFTYLEDDGGYKKIYDDGAYKIFVPIAGND